MIWQYAKASRKPDMIVQAESVDDVMAAVNFAREHGMKVTTRGGGHSTAACFMRDGGMLIDVSRLDGVVVDPASRIAQAGPGVICSGLNERLQEHGFAFPTAHCGTVPISGYLLGGGVGMNTMAWSQGMSVFGVQGVDIVVPDGRLLHASADENPDLFWAARGGGPGLFGVVTRFYLKCYDAPGVIYGATYTFDFKDYIDVVRLLDEVAPRMDRDVETVMFVSEAPPELVKGKTGPGANLAVYIDTNAFVANPEIGARKLERLVKHPMIARALAKEEDRRGTFDSYFVANEASFSQTAWVGDNIWTDHPVEAAQIIARHMPDCPAPRGSPLLLYMGDVAMPDAACSTRGRYYCSYYMEWDDPADEIKTREYSRTVFADLKKISNGSYINEMDQEGRPQDISTCYTPEAWAKLKQLRAKWDPTGVFHGFYGQT